jgi:hypothetical protein
MNLGPQDRERLLVARALVQHPELVRHHLSGITHTVDARGQQRPLRAPDGFVFVEMKNNSDMPVLVMVADLEKPK